MSGLSYRKLPPGEQTSVTAYVSDLAAYIRDPSTLRVRTLEQFGQAPSREECLRFIQERRESDAAARKRHESKLSYGVPKPTQKPRLGDDTPPGIARRCRCGVKIKRENTTGKCIACLHPGRRK